MSPKCFCKPFERLTRHCIVAFKGKNRDSLNFQSIQTLSSPMAKLMRNIYLMIAIIWSFFSSSLHLNHNSPIEVNSSSET